MEEEISNAFDEAFKADGLEIDWAEVERESQQADREAWDRLADKILNREV